MELEKCTNWYSLYSGKEVPSNSLELHSIHCRRNYMTCECGEVVNKQSFEAHRQEKHTPKVCKFCGVSVLPEFLKSHDCPLLPKRCHLCQAEFPLDQFKEHLYHCSSRTEQCPRCMKFIQIRDYEHHVEQVDCLGVKNTFQEKFDRISNEVYENFVGDPMEIDAEILRRVAEDQDREYAEEIFKKLMMEKSPGHSEEASPVKVMREEGEIGEQVKGRFDSAEPPEMQRGVSENSWGNVTDEEQLMNEAILKSLQDR